LDHGSVDQDPSIPVEDIDGVDFSFSFVRCPLTRFVSAVLNHGYTTPDKFEEFVLGKFLDNYEEKFETWCTPRITWAELQPQYRYVIREGKVSVDLLGGFENLLEDWDQVCKRAGVEYKLPHANKGKHEDHLKLYNKKTASIIYKAYEKDFEFFNYKKLI